MPSSDIPLSNLPPCSSKAKQQELNRWFGLRREDRWEEHSRRPSVRVSVILMQFHVSVLLLGSCCEEKPLTAISGTDQSQLCVAWRTRLILNNRLSAVPIFLASLVFPCPGFRAPAFAMSFRGSTNSREKIGTARSPNLEGLKAWINCSRRLFKSAVRAWNELSAILPTRFGKSLIFVTSRNFVCNGKYLALWFLGSFSNFLSFYPGFIALHLVLLKRGGEHPAQNWCPSFRSYTLDLLTSQRLVLLLPPNDFTNNVQRFRFYIFAP